MEKYQLNKIITFLIIFISVISLDQILKIWTINNIKINSTEEIPLLHYFIKLNYVINPGLVNGFLLNKWKYLKLVFFIIRLFTILYMFYYIIIKENEKNMYTTVGTSLIISGGFSNTIDWFLYGILFNNFSKEAPFKLFYGNVVDMLQLKINFNIPFFKYNLNELVFNIADLSVICGVIIYIFSNKFCKK